MPQCSVMGDSHASHIKTDQLRRLSAHTKVARARMPPIAEPERGSLLRLVGESRHELRVDAITALRDADATAVGAGEIVRWRLMIPDLAIVLMLQCRQSGSDGPTWPVAPLTRIIMPLHVLA
jgi:hypothetical protein